MPDLNEQILAELRGLRQDVGRGGGFASGNMTGQRMADQAWNGITNTASSLSKVSTGAYDLNGAIADVTKTFDIFGGVGQKLGAVFSGTINYVKDMNDAMIQSGRYGVTFSQNLFDYTGRLAGAQISFNDFNKLLGGAGKQIMGLGMNAQQSADFFLLNSAALARNEKVMVANLMGIGLTEFQDQLAITTDLFKNLDRTRIDTNRLIQQSTIAATIEIDNMARITGRSRQEIQKDIDQQQQSRLVQIAKMSMTPEQLANLNRTNAMMSQLGPGMADVYVQMMKFKNVVTPEGREIAGAMNLVMPGFMEKMQQMANSTDEREIARLQEELKYMLGQAAADEKRMDQLTILATRNEGVAKMFAEIFGGKGRAQIDAYAQQYRAAGGDSARFQELTEDSARLRDSISKQILQLNQAGGPGAAISQMLLGLDRAIKSGQTAVGKYIESFEATAGKKLEGIDARGMFNEIMNLQNMTPEQIETFAKKLISSTAVDVDNAPPDGKPQGIPRYGETTTNPLHVNVVNESIRTKAEQRAMGSLGANGPMKVDKWFEDFGSGMIMQLDGRESVVREDQRLAFAMDTLKESGVLSSMIAGLRSIAPTGAQGNETVMRDLTTAITTLPQQIKIPEFKFPATADDDKKLLSDAIDRLNTKMDTLIAAVEDGSKGTVKAVRTQNNLIG